MITGIIRHEGCRQWGATLVVEQIEVLQQEMCYVGTWFNTRAI